MAHLCPVQCKLGLAVVTKTENEVQNINSKNKPEFENESVHKLQMCPNKSSSRILRRKGYSKIALSFCL